MLNVVIVSGGDAVDAVDVVDVVVVVGVFSNDKLHHFRIFSVGVSIVM